VRNIFKSLSILALTLAFASNSHALTYDFEGTRVIAGVFDEGASRDRSAVRDHFFTRSATSTLTFESTLGSIGNVQIAIDGLARTGKGHRGENGFEWVPGAFGESDYSLFLEISNATQLLDDNGEIIGYIGGTGSTSSGKFRIDEIGGRSFEAEVDLTKMNFSQYAGNNDWTGQVAAYGDVLFFTLEDLRTGDFFTRGWFSGLGTEGRYIEGDLLLTNGAEVPEPMTAALLGMGLLGGAIRKRKNDA